MKHVIVTLAIVQVSAHAIIAVSLLVSGDLTKGSLVATIAVECYVAKHTRVASS